MTFTNEKPIVLLVDDEEDIRQVVHLMLKREGFDVLQAANGMEAFSILSSGQKVDLLICDVIMPLLRGNELISLLQKGKNSVPVIVISGHFSDAKEEETRFDSSEEVTQALTNVHELIRKSPQDDFSAAFLPKPFTRRQLLNLVVNLLPERKMAA